jgi:hypothetical protein
MNTEKLPYWKTELMKIKQCPQRQDALNNQLADLAIVANKLGFYDAADYLKKGDISPVVTPIESKEMLAQTNEVNQFLHDLNNTLNKITYANFQEHSQQF